MITTTITTTPDVSSVEKFAKAFAGYIAAHPARVVEMLNKKGNNLGYLLFKGFADRKFGGPGKHPGVAFEQARARGASGDGTVLRDRLQQIFNKGRADLTRDVRSAGQRKRIAERHGVAGIGLRQQQLERGAKAREARANLWGKVLETELSLRQSGVGALAASFLWFKQKSATHGVRPVSNRIGTRVGICTVTPDGMEIRSVSPAIADVAARYGIVDKALGESADDMFKYLADRNWEAMPRP